MAWLYKAGVSDMILSYAALFRFCSWGNVAVETDVYTKKRFGANGGRAGLHCVNAMGEIKLLVTMRPPAGACEFLSQVL